MKRSLCIFLAALFLAWTAEPLCADSSRRLPAIYSVSTFGGSTRDYTTLAAWESDTDNNLTEGGIGAQTCGQVLDCYPDSASYDQRVTLMGATANAGYFRVIRAAPGHERQVVFDYTGALGTYEGVICVNGESYAGIYDLVIRHHVNQDNITKDLFFQSNPYACRVVGCVAGPSENANPTGVGGAQTYNGRAVFINTTFLGNNTGVEYGIIAGTADTAAYNCIFYGWSTGWYGAAAGSFAKNSIFQANGADFYSNTPALTTCIYSGHGTASFVDPASGNFRLADSDTNARDQGTNLSADTMFAFTDDFDGDARPYGSAWDIGVDEWTAPTALVSIPVF